MPNFVFNHDYKNKIQKKYTKNKNITKYKILNTNDRQAKLFLILKS